MTKCSETKLCPGANRRLYLFLLVLISTSSNLSSSPGLSTCIYCPHLCGTMESFIAPPSGHTGYYPRLCPSHSQPANPHRAGRYEFLWLSDPVCFNHSCTSCLGVQKGKHSISLISPACLFLHFYPETIKGRWLWTMCLIHCPSLFLPGSIEGAHNSGRVRIVRVLFNLSYFSTISAQFFVLSASFS